jgi:lipopolysaccharide export system ATP-binding protein
MSNTTFPTQQNLVATQLKKGYGARQVVKDVSLTVAPGEVVGLLGPNGAGKTTCFYMIVGLIQPESGSVTLYEKDITLSPIHQRAKLGISYLPQEASIFRHLTVAENIQAILEMQSNDEHHQPLQKSSQVAWVKQRCEHLLNELNITHIRDSLGLSLSGGERRRVEIARALASHPKFILLDEPFAGVDPIAVIEIQKIIRYLTAQNIGVLITDHNVRETLNICHKAYIISEGRVLASGTPDVLIENTTVRKVYLGDQFRM